MTPAEIPQELIDILDKRAGKAHSRDGHVVGALAEILTAYEGNKLGEAVDRILMNATDDSWTQLCIATVKLGAAFAEFDNARKKYIASQKEKHES